MEIHEYQGISAVFVCRPPYFINRMLLTSCVWLLRKLPACIKEQPVLMSAFPPNLSPLLEASFRFLLVRLQRMFGLDLRILLLLI